MTLAYTATPSKPAIRPSALASYDYDALDDLLYDWFLRETGYQPVIWYPRTAAMSQQAVSSSQWDDSDEVNADRVEAFVMPVVSACMDELDGDYRVAIIIEQRNRAGSKVWRNPRAGDRQPEVYAAAKEAIKPLLSKRGVVW